MRVAAAVLTGLLMLGLPQTASAETGAQRFHVTYSGPFDPSDPPERRVTAAGPIRGQGYESLISEGPGPEPNTFQATTEFVLPDGRVFLAASGTSESRFNPHSCTAYIRVTGEWIIRDGTAVYQDATGKGSFEGHNIVFFQRTSSGCSQQPDRLVTNLRLVGTATAGT